MSKIHYLTTALTCAACLPGVAFGAKNQKQASGKSNPLSNSKMNIVFVFADDWGWGDLSGHGHPGLKTPNLDKMASEGIDFTQFNVCSPVSSSSRTAVMTGHFPSRHNIHQHLAGPSINASRGMANFAPVDAAIMGKMMQKAGYKTAHFGKWHLGNNGGAPEPAEYGFDATCVYNGRGPQIKQGPAEYPSAFYTQQAVDLAIDFIGKNKKSPFFVNVWIHETHHAIEPSPEMRIPYLDVEEPQQSYYSVVTSADENIGRLMTFLKEQGLDENTLVIFSSDNGPAPNDTKRTWNSVGVTGGQKGQKHSLYEGGVRIPFIVRLPGIVPAGKVDKHSFIAAVDLLPTFCDIAGIELPESHKPDGEVITNVLLGNKFDRTKTVLQFWQGRDTGHDWPRLTAKDNNYKLVMNYDMSRVELYDYRNDWGEEKNLASQHPDVVEKLSKEALAYFKSLNIKPEHLAFGTAEKVKKTPEEIAKAKAKKAAKQAKKDTLE